MSNGTVSSKAQSVDYIGVGRFSDVFIAYILIVIRFKNIVRILLSDNRNYVFCC